MRKISIAFASILTMLSLSACTDDSSATADNTKCTPGTVVLSICEEADLAHAAFTLEELITDSDVVVEGIVTSSTGVNHYGNGALIYTQMQINLIKTHKGEYTDQPLISVGGTLKLSDYLTHLSAEHPAKNNHYTADELENGMVASSFENNFAPQVGDHILFFGQYDALDPNAIFNTNTTQGLYCCDGETIYTTALHINENGWTEPLAEDMIARCEGTVTAPLISETASPALSVERDAFLEILGSSSNS